MRYILACLPLPPLPPSPSPLNYYLHTKQYLYWARVRERMGWRVSLCVGVRARVRACCLDGVLGAVVADSPLALGLLVRHARLHPHHTTPTRRTARVSRASRFA